MTVSEKIKRNKQKLRFRSVGSKSCLIKQKNKHVNDRIEDFPTRNEQIKKGTKRGAAAIIEKEKEMENDTCVWGVRDRMESDVPASVLVAIVVSREGTKPQQKNGEKR